MPQRAKQMLRSLRRFYHQRTASRDIGLRHETSFWDRWFQTAGLEWPDEYNARLDPSRPLGGIVTELADAIDAPIVRILDVGAGPLTLLGKIHPRKTLDITATDVLAPVYDDLLRRYGVTPLVRTLAADAELLTATFPANHFHIVHAQNCLDHMQNPLRAIEQMLEVTAGGGAMVLIHRENEAEFEDYAGLHQWNFTAISNTFIIHNPRQRYDVSAAFDGKAQMSCTVHEGWLTVLFRKAAV